MLKDAHARGAATAFNRFHVKQALSWRDIRTGLIGEPLKALGQVAGGSAFRPGGMMHWKNVLWPTIPGHPGQTWLGRASGTILPALGVMSAMRGQGNPAEGRLTNTLGTAGEALGFAYGFPATGVLGSMALGGAGRTLGQGLGRMLGSHPAPTLPTEEGQALEGPALMGEPYR